MSRAFALSAALLAALVAAAPATAQETNASEGARLKLGVGYYDLFDTNEAVQVKAELHSSREWWILHPFVGIEANNDGGIWGGVGVAADLDLSPQWVITPSTSVGLYEEGDSKDLGGVIEFKSGLEVAYKFDNGHRLGAEITHMSNASIYDSNPGTEVVSINYHMPLGVFGR